MRLLFTILALVVAAGFATAASAPQAAVDACLRHADAYNGVDAGTSKFTGSVEADVAWFGPGAGGNFRLRTGTEGGVALICTVSADGKKVALEPVEN